MEPSLIHYIDYICAGCKQSPAWFIILAVCLYGKPSLSRSGADTRAGGWLPWARWMLAPVPLPPLGHQRRLSTCSSEGRAAGSVATPGQRGHLLPSSAPSPGHRGWCGDATLAGIVKNWAAKAMCVWFGLCVLRFPHGVSHPSPFWGWVWGEICPLVRSAFSASLFSWYPADMELLVLSCGDQQKLSYI